MARASQVVEALGMDQKTSRHRSPKESLLCTGRSLSDCSWSSLDCGERAKVRCLKPQSNKRGTAHRLVTIPGQQGIGNSILMLEKITCFEQINQSGGLVSPLMS